MNLPAAVPPSAWSWREPAGCEIGGSARPFAVVHQSRFLANDRHIVVPLNRDA
jgi:hypothetical protein